MSQGRLYIISSVAGGGKSTLIRKLLAEFPEILFSVSCTSRDKRPMEQNGLDYYFITKEEFQKKIQEDYFLEWALVHDNYYGTPKDFILNGLNQNKKIILDIDVQGAENVKKKIPSAISIFILPPSQEVWLERLKNRGTESREALEKRIKNGLKELNYKDKFDFRIINDTLERAYTELKEIIWKENL